MSDDLDPMSQHDVEREILRLSVELTHTTVQNAQHAEEHAQADVDYKRASARAWIENIGHKGTVAEKEASVFERCADEYSWAKVTEARYKATQEKGRNLRAQLDALRTIAANVRSAVDHSRGEGW